jgi:hypothetical protein
VAHLDDLIQLRDDIRVWLDEAPVDRKAALVAQYRATLAEITALSPAEQKVGDPVDEIAARRSARGAGAAPSASRTRTDAR